MAITSDTILRALHTSNVAPVKGILFLYERQTEDEREMHDTKWKNERGFRVNHAAAGAILAEKILNNEGWTADDMRQARGICESYAHTQLLDLARTVHGCK